MYGHKSDYDKEKAELERYFLSTKPISCELCKKKIFYVGGGKYECHECGHTMYDDFGKVKAFLDENGPKTAYEISVATGVRQNLINFFLKQGKLEIIENSKYYLSCEKCGCAIRYGRYCPECITELAGSMKAVFSADAGERPKSLVADGKAKYHYFKK